MQDGFVYTGTPTRVIFGSGTLPNIADEAARLGLFRLLVVSTPRQSGLADKVAELLASRTVGTCPLAAMHTPVEVTEKALGIARSLGADGLVAVGGGSTTGLAKALSIRLGLPQIAIPTTYAGSEMTPILGETANGIKTTRRDPAILPDTVIYDVDLTLDLPVGISVTSGMNAIAHAVEAHYAKDRNPVISLLAEQSIACIAAGLPRIHADMADSDARFSVLYGAWSAGKCLGSVGMAIHHKLCHTLGGTFSLPHAETHSVILPHAIAYVGDAAPETMSMIRRALGSEDAAGGLFDLSAQLGAPISLRSIGMPDEAIAEAADFAMKNPYWNPRPLERGALFELLSRAQTGERPC